MFRRDIGNQSISWCTTHAFANPVEQTRAQHDTQGRRQRKQWFSQGAEGIAEERQAFALVEIIAERAGKHLDDQRRCFGQPLDQPDQQGACPQCRNHEQGQQAMDHFRRNIHQHTDETEYPDPGRNATFRHFYLLHFSLFIVCKTHNGASLTAPIGIFRMLRSTAKNDLISGIKSASQHSAYQVTMRKTPQTSGTMPLLVDPVCTRRPTLCKTATFCR